MSKSPEMFQQQSLGAWLGLAAFVALLCFLYPPMLGFVAGIAWFYLVFFFFYKVLGG